MAVLTNTYRNSLVQYRRYLEAVRDRPLLQASLFVILTLILLIILVAFALRPTLLTIAGLYGDLGAQRKITLQLDKHIQDQAAAAQNYNQNQAQLALLDAAIPSLPSVDAWVTQIDAMAAQSSVVLDTVKVSKIGIVKDVTGTIMQSDFFLFVKGDFANLKTFLKALESSRRLVQIGSITVNKNATIDGQLQMQITGQILYSKQ